MITDHYASVHLFALVPKVMAEFEPELRELDRLLDDDDILARVRAEMTQRRRQSRTRGRPSTPVEVVLRLLVVKRLSGWSYEQTERFVADSLVLRQFCRIYLQPVPDDTTLIRWATLIGPQTVERINDRVVELARQRRVTRGRTLRVDRTVVETTLHHPTASRLLGDGVRVRSRLLRRAKTVLGGAGDLGAETFRTRTRSMRRLAQQVHRQARRKGEVATAEMNQLSQRVLTVTMQSRHQAETVASVLRTQTSAAAQRLVQQCETFLPRVDQAIQQAERRVLRGETVPAGEKSVSLFEPHTQVI